MNNRDHINRIIVQFSGVNNVIPIPRIYLEITGDYPAAALLNQMVYWSDKTKRNDGYFYKTNKEWQEELHLSKYQVSRATDKLKSLNLVETSLKKANGAPTLHYKVDLDLLGDSIVKKLNNGKLRNLTIESKKTGQSLTEITTEITTEKEILSSNARPYQQIINYLNDKAGKNFKHTTEANKRLINGRYNDGHTLEDFMKVIDNKVSQWKGTDNEMYLRPKTLFSPSNFEGYLNEVPKGSSNFDINSFLENIKE